MESEKRDKLQEKLKEVFEESSEFRKEIKRDWGDIPEKDKLALVHWGVDLLYKHSETEEEIKKYEEENDPYKGELPSEGGIVYSSYPFGKKPNLRPISLVSRDIPNGIQIATISTPHYAGDIKLPLLADKDRLFVLNECRGEIEEIVSRDKTRKSKLPHEGFNGLSEHRGKIYVSSREGVYELNEDLQKGFFGLDSFQQPAFRLEGEEMVDSLASTGISFFALTNSGQIKNLETGKNVGEKDGRYDHIAGFEGELFAWEDYSDIVNIESGKKFSPIDFGYINALIPMKDRFAYSLASDKCGKVVVHPDGKTEREYGENIISLEGKALARGLANKVTSAVYVPQEFVDKVMGLENEK